MKNSLTWTYIGVAMALFGPGAVALLSNAVATEPETVLPRVTGLVVFIGLCLAVLWIGVRRESLGWRGMGFAGSGRWTLPVSIALAAFFVLVFGPLAYAMLEALETGSFGDTIERFEALPRWYLLLAVIVVAGGEEWLYRGYAIERLEALTGNVWIAGGISLIAFVLVHLPLWGVGPSLTFLVSGAILTVVYIQTRDVLSLILAHIATDVYGIVFA